MFQFNSLISQPNSMARPPLESSFQDDSNEWSHHRVWLRNGKIKFGKTRGIELSSLFTFLILPRRLSIFCVSRVHQVRSFLIIALETYLSDHIIMLSTEVQTVITISSFLGRMSGERRFCTISQLDEDQFKLKFLHLKPTCEDKDIPVTDFNPRTNRPDK